MFITGTGSKLTVGTGYISVGQNVNNAATGGNGILSVDQGGLEFLIGGHPLRPEMPAIDAAVRAGPFANALLLAMIDATAAGFVWAAVLALALVQVVLYRRLAR